MARDTPVGLCWALVRPRVRPADPWRDEKGVENVFTAREYGPIVRSMLSKHWFIHVAESPRVGVGGLGGWYGGGLGDRCWSGTVVLLKI